jgi:hypothetical protein
MYKIEKKIKLLSVNQAWQGKRFKTKSYDLYEKTLLYTLPNEKIQLIQSYYIIFIFNFSNKLSDWDNPIKPLQDILQKKYGFNDRDVKIALVYKKIVPKKDEGFIVYIGDSKKFYDDLKIIKTQQDIE